MERDSRLKLGQFIASHRHTPFEIGVCDCNIFTAEWVDCIKNTKLAQDIKHKYKSARQMLRFSKIKKIKEELSKAGYSVVQDSPQTGDILIRKDPAGFYHSAIVMNDFAYTMDKDKDLVKAHTRDIMELTPETEVWRTA